MFTTVKIIKRGLVSIAVIAALCAPASASARVLPQSVYVQTAQESPSAPTYSSPSSGFQWDDAALGAAGMLALLGVATASSQQVRRRRQTFAS